MKSLRSKVLYKSKSKSYRSITDSGYKFIVIWVALFILATIISGYYVISFINNVKLEESGKCQLEAPNAFITTKNESPQDDYSNKKRDSTDVTVGIYIDHIKELNMKDSKWRLDFIIWFVYYGTLVKPQESFHLINGYIDKEDIKEIYKYFDNKSNLSYYEYEAIADIAENFDSRLYPLDNQYIIIKIKDLDDDIRYLTYRCDKNNSTVSDRINLTGFEVINYYTTVSSHVDETNFGIPNKKLSDIKTYSHFNFILLLQRSNKILLFLRLFEGLIVAVFVSMLAFFIRPTWVDPRFGLGIGGLFAAVANNYIVSSALPIAGIVTLAGIIHGIGIAVIFFTIVQSVLSLYIYDNLNARSLSQLFDRVSFVLFTSIFIIFIAAIILSATNTASMLPHQVFFEDSYSNDTDIWIIEDPSVLTAVYATLEKSEDIDYYIFEGQKNQSIILRTEIPQITGQEDFTPTMDITGPTNFSRYLSEPITEPNNESLLNLPLSNIATHFFKQFRGPLFLKRQDKEIILPANGRYMVKVQDLEGQTGCYVFLIGNQKTYGGDVKFNQKMRNFLTSSSQCT